MEKLKEKLKTINEHIISVYSERDLKLDEIKQHLQDDYEKKVLFHKEKKEILIQEWYKNVLEEYGVGTIILHNRGYRHYNKKFSFFIINSVNLKPGELEYRRYGYEFETEQLPKWYDVIVEVVEIGTNGLLSKVEEVVVDRLYWDSEYDRKPKVLCNVSEIPSLTKRHKLPTKMNHKLCMDIYKVLYEEVVDVQTTKDLLKKYGLS
jgi:hypothetical protein